MLVFLKENFFPLWILKKQKTKNKKHNEQTTPWGPSREELCSNVAVGSGMVSSPSPRDLI